MADWGLLRAASAGAALLLALCAGAVWSVVALILGGDAAFMALPAALVVLHGLGYVKPATRMSSVAISLGLYLVAVAYAHYLNAASVISSQLGLEFIDVLRDVGPEMATALTMARTTALDTATIAIVGIGLAILAARYPTAPRNGSV
jgi:hypothetical protein